MKILFISLDDFFSIEESGIYTDLLRKFRDYGHEIYALSPTDKILESPQIVNEPGVVILKIPIEGLQKSSNYIKKGISTIAFGLILKRKIRKALNTVCFDLVLYPTPPVTIYSAVRFVKKRDHAMTYLMLKDIFPQGAVDLNALTKSGLKGVAYWYFRWLERKLYKISDFIGCTSPANISYLHEHNPKLDLKKIGLCPNCIEVMNRSIDDDTRREVRIKYEIPPNKTVFIYGGNLGRPQGIPFVIECLDRVKDVGEAFFLIVGGGTEYDVLQEYFTRENPQNAKLLSMLPKLEYDTLVNASDIGLIFLDHRYTVPNTPTRLLPCLEAGIPVLAVTDPHTDIGSIIVNNGFGWWCESNDADCFQRTVKRCLMEDLKQMGARGHKYLMDNYTTEHGYKSIIQAYRQSKVEM